MVSLGDNVNKILLAGIGAVAATAEKSGEILEELVKKGELTVEQGKVLNEELKHNIKEKVRENVKVSVKPSTPEELEKLLDKMTPEQVAALKQKLEEMEQVKAAAGQDGEEKDFQPDCETSAEEACQTESQECADQGCQADGEAASRQEERKCCQDAGEPDSQKGCEEE